MKPKARSTNHLLTYYSSTYTHTHTHFHPLCTLSIHRSPTTKPLSLSLALPTHHTLRCRINYRSKDTTTTTTTYAHHHQSANHFLFLLQYALTVFASYINVCDMVYLEYIFYILYTRTVASLDISSHSERSLALLHRRISL